MTDNRFYTYELCDSREPFTPFYIGKGTGNRLNEHVTRAKGGYHHNPYLQNKINKILREGGSINTNKIEENLTEDEAFAKEIRIISDLRDIGLRLCNMTDGGDGTSGHRHSEETRKKIREKRAKQIITEDMKRRIGESQKGRIGWNKGSACPEETRKKISMALKGKPHSSESIERMRKAKMGHGVSEEAKKNMSAAHKGRKHSEETKKKMRGRIPWNKGKEGLYRLSEETRKKMREAQNRRRTEERRTINGGHSE